MSVGMHESAPYLAPLSIRFPCFPTRPDQIYYLPVLCRAPTRGSPIVPSSLRSSFAILLRTILYIPKRRSGGSVPGTMWGKSLPIILSHGHSNGPLPCKKENAAHIVGGAGIKPWQCPTFARGKPRTIIGAERFHFRVRNGIGWFPLAMATRKSVCPSRPIFRSGTQANSDKLSKA